MMAESVRQSSQVIIRSYQKRDSHQVGRLIAATYREINLSSIPEDEVGAYLGPFQFAWSPEKNHQEAIEEIIQSEIVLVAETEGEIVGVLRGRPVRLGSLFVRKENHRQGIGRRLVEQFEKILLNEGSSVIHVAATIYAVSFYLAMGYKKSTGVRL